MTELQNYIAVNKSTTTRELLDVVAAIYDAGDLRQEDKEFTLDSIQDYPSHPKYYANNITRKYGIRQQVLMLNFYNR